MIRKILPLLMLISALSLTAKEKCKVIVTASNEAKPHELVIKKEASILGTQSCGQNLNRAYMSVK